MRDFFTGSELTELNSVLREFHEAWLRENAEAYSRHAINSAYITGGKHLSRERRSVIFQFIGRQKIDDIVSSIIPRRSSFINTQLFFDPADVGQKNYWHRDIQYADLSIEAQAAVFDASEVLHLRVPLAKERGIELVPGSHRRWDSKEELEVRMERAGRKRYDDLSTAAQIPLRRGDLLVFSANMIHRGLYGGGRFAFDICVADEKADVFKYVSEDCLPDEQDLKKLECPQLFLNTIELMRAAS